MSENTTTITQATVYTHSSAQITRFGEVEVTETGEQTIEFPMLASRIEENSLQVQGGGKAILKDVKISTKHFAKEQHKKLKPLKEELAKLEEKQELLTRKELRIKSEAELLMNLANKVFAPADNGKVVQVDFNPEKWGSTLDFYRERQSKLDEEALALKEETKQNLAEINKKTSQIKQFSAAGKKSKEVIEIVLDVKEAGKMQFEISYLAKGANWKPNYDIRVDSENQKVQVNYQATVRNNTGEDWENVKLSLSTAKPFISSKPPKLNTWFLNRYNPPPSAKANRSVRRSAPAKAMKMAVLEEAAAPYPELGIDADEFMESSETTVDTKTSSVLFNIGGGSTIISDNQPQKVSILQEDFKSD